MNSTSTYLFYDIETTGLNKCFDQVLQFAAIRTDMSLNELARYQIQIKLNPDVIPSPEAMLIHKISIHAMQSGINEFEGIRQIHQLMNRPGTISVGYNTLNFDDECLRFAFYRNLLPPYTHQFANQCGRMDIYPIVVLFHLFKPDVLQWPSINGRVSLKLENIAAQNNLLHLKAHDAMSDVEATLALTRILFQQKEMWNYIIGYFNKKTDLARIQKLSISFSNEFNAFQEAILVQGRLGSELYYQAPVISLGQHQHYKNQLLWLRLDNHDLSLCRENNIAEITRIFRKRAAEQKIILPALHRYQKFLTPERIDLASRNKQWLKENPNKLQLICDYHQHDKYPVVNNVDADAALYYQAFPSIQEEKLFQQFHQVSLPEKEKLLLHLSTARREQAIRILGRHHGNDLSEENKNYFKQYLSKIKKEETGPIDFRGQKRLTIDTALSRIEALPPCDLLQELKEYLLAL